eukprot:sb/3473273/
MRPAILGLVVLPALISALSFKLNPEGTRCIKEEVHKGVLVVGEFKIEGLQGSHEVDISVTDSKDGKLFAKEKAESGKFAFTLDDYDMFSVCFKGQRKSEPISGGDIFIYPASLNKPPVASSATGALSINCQLGGGLFPTGWQFILVTEIQRGH